MIIQNYFKIIFLRYNIMWNVHVLKDIDKIYKKEKVSPPKKPPSPKKDNRQLLRDISVENFLKYQWSWTL